MEIAITGVIYRPVESREELVHLSFWLRHHTDSLSFYLFIQQFSILYHFCLNTVLKLLLYADVFIMTGENKVS